MAFIFIPSFGQRHSRGCSQEKRTQEDIAEDYVHQDIRPDPITTMVYRQRRRIRAENYKAIGKYWRARFKSAVMEVLGFSLYAVLGLLLVYVGGELVEEMRVPEILPVLCTAFGVLALLRCFSALFENGQKAPIPYPSLRDEDVSFLYLPIDEDIVKDVTDALN